MNSLTREKGDTKEFRRLVLCSFGKGRRETQKEFRRLVLGEFFLAKGEENEKMNSTSFQGLENQKTSESFWYKEEEEVQRDSRLVKDCKRLIGKVFKIERMNFKSKSKPCFYRLFMSGQEDHLEEL